MPLGAPRWLSCGVIMTRTPHPSRLQDTCALSIANLDCRKTAKVIQSTFRCIYPSKAGKSCPLERNNGLSETLQIARNASSRSLPKARLLTKSRPQLPRWKAPFDLQRSVGGKMCECGRSISSNNPRGSCTSKFETRPALQCQHIFVINLMYDAIGVATSSVSTVHGNSTTCTLQMMCMYA